MSEEEDNKEVVKSPQEEMNKIKEKMRGMQRDGSSSPSIPLGRESLSGRMARMESRGPPRRMIKVMKEFRTDLLEVKKYLKEIVDHLQEQ